MAARTRTYGRPAPDIWTDASAHMPARTARMMTVNPHTTNHLSKHKRTMKNLHTIMAAGLTSLLAFTACSDWLDVNPKSQVKGDVLFENESGFRDALIGTYTLLGGTDLYGGNETMGLMDILAQSYSEVGTTLEEAPKYNYDNSTVETRINAIWSGNYNAIANCNYMLDVIDEK